MEEQIAKKNTHFLFYLLFVVLVFALLSAVGVIMYSLIESQRDIGSALTLLAPFIGMISGPVQLIIIIVIMGWALSRDPDIFDIWHSSKTKEGEFNFISYKNTIVDSLLLEGRSTFNLEKRKSIYHQIHTILSEEQPCTFLYVPDALPVLNKRFKGVEKAPLGIWYNFIHWHVPKDKIEWYR